MKVAFVHDWLVTYRGGEKVLEAMLELFPDAPIFTLFYDREKMPSTISSRDVRFPKWLNRFKKIRKLFLPLYPSIIEAMPLEGYDLIISTSSCVAKGAIPGPSAKHLCYIHSPMRYVWDQRSHYAKSFGRIPLFLAIFHTLCTKLRMWDTLSSHRVDQFVANSSFVKDRVSKYYGRSAEIVHPPVDVSSFKNSCQRQDAPESYYLAAGALVAYKRFDLAIEACEAAGKRLVVAGSGPEEQSLRKLAGSNTTFSIQPSDNEWKKLISNADALIFPGIEDFGIVAIEALSAGTPIIAFRGGGALDFVVPQNTGTFFNEMTVDSLAKVIKEFKPENFLHQDLVSFAERFTKENFQRRMRTEIENLTETPA